MAAIRPMLAVRAEPFDSPEYLFEVKWNGVRALAAREGTAWHLWGRKQADYRPRYPELAALSRLADGTVLDGEIVLLHNGWPGAARSSWTSRPGRPGSASGRPAGHRHAWVPRGARLSTTTQPQLARGSRVAL
jgi:ATP dependent DNA ligase domain